MLQNTKRFYGAKLGALDGEIGHIKDFYFDDKTWAVRYLVIDTGSWLTGREVLLSPHAFGAWNEAEKILAVNLTRKQIENSPSPESHRPVSRAYEMEFYRYYGWPAYWEGTDIWGISGSPVLLPPLPENTPESRPKYQHRGDKHLRSSRAVNGYHIQALDGSIGQIAGFLVDDKQWTIRELVVETGHWYAGKEVLIPPTKVERISHEEFKVFVNLTQGEIRHTAENGVAHGRK